MTIFNYVAASAVLALSMACGPGQESKTVTNSDTTTTNGAGTTQTKTTDTQVRATDGSKDTTHTEEVKQQTPPPSK